MSELIERYEYKFLVSARHVPHIRELARLACRIDKNANADGTYLIRSLYLDSDRYDLYWANEREQADRFKMRIRTYPGKKSPVFLEVKRRFKDVIVKSRALVSADIWQKVITCDGPTLDKLPPNTRANVMPFLARLHRHHLHPVLLVQYEREAYVSEIDSYARLTFDKKIVVQPIETFELEADPHRWRPVDHTWQTRTTEPMTVLELKFERRPPAWMVAMVRQLGLVRGSFSKYCYGINAELTLPSQRTSPTTVAR